MHVSVEAVSRAIIVSVHLLICADKKWKAEWLVRVVRENIFNFHIYLF